MTHPTESFMNLSKVDVLKLKNNDNIIVQNIMVIVLV